MGLGEVQAALARLYTEPAIRDMLENDPEALQRECGLTDEDLEHLTHLSASELEFFATSLRSKRRGEVAKLLPGTAAALGGQYRLMFNRYSDRFLPSGEQKHLEDALHFAEYLGLVDVPGKPWVASIVAYECAWLEIVNQRRRFIVRHLQHNVRTESAHPEPANNVAIWTNHWLLGRHHWMFRLPG